MKFERKFGNKMYKVVYVVWVSLSGESGGKERATKMAKQLRAAGFSSHVRREMHVKDYHRRINRSSWWIKMTKKTLRDCAQCKDLIHCQAHITGGNIKQCAPIDMRIDLNEKDRLN